MCLKSSFYIRVCQYHLRQALTDFIKIDRIISSLKLFWRSTMVNEIISLINDALYSKILIIVLILGGLYFTFRTKFVQFRLFKEQIRAVT